MARYISEMTPEDRAWVLERMREIRDELDTEGGPGKRQIQREARYRLYSEAQEGSEQAERVLKALETDGLEGPAEIVLSEDRMSVQLDMFETIDLPARVGIPVYDEDGRLIEWIKPLLVSLEWFQNHVSYDREATRVANGLKRLAARNKIFELEKEFPDSKSAIDACEQAGIDWRDLRLGGLGG